ncbi:MAG: DUF4870 domain-containing protein [Anaerolineaceae bacterium]|nr:DUF4870 domain-containing protein [Anaerolineaceae bacterium]
MKNKEQWAFPHIYRPKWTVHLINFSVFLLMTFFSAAYFIFTILPYFYLMRDNPNPDFMMSASSIILFPIVLVSALTYLLLVAMLVSNTFSTLTIREKGLTYKSWPQLHVRCKWADVHLIGKHLWISDVLHLNHFEKIGTSLSLKKPFSSFRVDRMSIPLSKFSGWKNGALADDLHNLAPQLFDEQYIQQTKQSVIQSRTSNERFLSAISHASFYLGLMGIILPIILWFEQKEKSTYTRYQAVQAIIWQIVVHVFMVIFMVLLTVFLSAIVIIGTLYQNTPGMQTMIVIGMVILALATLLFLVILLLTLLYPTIAVIQTAQGKEFSFALVGKLVKRK